MFQLAPIDTDFVPYSRRPVRKNNAGLFITRGRRGGVAGVALQASIVVRPPGRCQYQGQCCGPHLSCDGGGFCSVPDTGCPD